MTSETTHHLVCGFAWSPNQKPTAEVIWVGIPRSVQSFLNDAIQKGHPKSLLTRVPDPALQKLVDNLLGSRLKEPGAGLDKLEEWETRRAESQVCESKIREAMDPIVNRILKGKETVLLEQLLNEYKFPDSHLVRDMRSGFALSGWVRNSKLFVPFLRPPRSTVAMQLALAPAKKTLVERTLNVQPEGSVAEATWAETQAEAAQGWITEDKDASMERHLVAPRFGVDQGTKVRVIDNGKMAGINSTIGLPEKFRLHDVTFIAAFIVCALGDKRSKGAQVSGKTLDLKSAYKQYATRPEDRELMRIAAKDMSDGAIRLYKPCALPFGTTGSVSGFLRTAAAAWFLGTEAVKLCWGNYFDDYPMFALDQDTEASEACAQGLMNVLGIEYASEGKKATVFGKQCRALGLIIDLSDFGSGRVILKHTPERVNELHRTITKILDADHLSPMEAESLRGRLHWFSTFLFGRRSTQALRQVGRRASGDDRLCKLDEPLKAALFFLRDTALNSRPITLSADSQRTFLVFTDGSLEGDKAELGGVLFSQEGAPLSFYSMSLSSEVLARLRLDSKHPIYEVELLGTWIGLHLWQQKLKDSYAVFYIDNEAAKGSLIKGISNTRHGQTILSSFIELEEKTVCRCYFARVPTSANPADAPSRGQISHLVGAKVERAYFDGQLPLA